MARKLYIFSPTGRIKTDGQLPAKWLGGYSTTHAYLGDYQARMLGVGTPLPTGRLPDWMQTPSGGMKVFKGGASRMDRGFRGWG